LKKPIAVIAGSQWLIAIQKGDGKLWVYVLGLNELPFSVVVLP
jgi:hypothetical protein